MQHGLQVAPTRATNEATKVFPVIMEEFCSFYFNKLRHSRCVLKLMASKGKHADPGCSLCHLPFIVNFKGFSVPCADPPISSVCSQMWEHRVYIVYVTRIPHYGTLLLVCVHV